MKVAQFLPNLVKIQVHLCAVHLLMLLCTSFLGYCPVWCHDLTYNTGSEPSIVLIKSVNACRHNSYIVYYTHTSSTHFL